MEEIELLGKHFPFTNHCKEWLKVSETFKPMYSIENNCYIVYLKENIKAKWIEFIIWYKSFQITN